MRAAVLQEKEALKKNNQHTSQQGTSAKPSSNSRPARLEIDKCEDDDMQVDDEGMGNNEEREVTEGTEMNERHNEASKAVESGTKRKTHKKGNNPSPERYVTCDVAFACFVCLHGSHPDSHSHSLLQTTSKKATCPAHICKQSFTPYLGCSSQLGMQPL